MHNPHDPGWRAVFSFSGEASGLTGLRRLFLMLLTVPFAFLQVLTNLMGP
jgi:hypothetical protein